MLKQEAMVCPAFKHSMQQTNHVFPTTTSFGCGNVFKRHFHYSGRYKEWQKKLFLVQQLFKVDYANAAVE